MKDIEIIVFNDKSYVRFFEYEKLKQKIEKMKCCANCKNSYLNKNEYLQCDLDCLNYDKWELAE